MKRLLFTFIVFLFATTLFSQGSITFTDKPFIITEAKDTSIQNNLLDNDAFNQLDKEEQEVVYWINYVRQKPESFYKTVLVPFLNQFPETKSAYTRSLISDLSTAVPAKPVYPSKKLNETALAHAKDLGSKGLSISHTSSSGQSFQQRMNAAGLYQCISENIYEGRDKALESVIFLLIDSGVKNLGHRKNILDPNAKQIGVSFFSIKGRTGMFFLVEDFSCE